MIDDSTTQPTTELESLDELKRYYTSAQLQVTTTEEEYDDPDLTSVSMSTKVQPSGRKRKVHFRVLEIIHKDAPPIGRV